MADNVKVINHIGEVMAELESRIPTILEALGEEAEGNAVDEINKLVYDTPETPNYVRTGYLKNSITHATYGKNGTSYSIDENGDYHEATVSNDDSNSVIIGSALEYAPYVEMGTSKMAPRPFLKNAINNYIEDYKQIIEEGLS